MTEVNHIASEEGFPTAFSSVPASALAVVYFHAPWAAPCKQMSQVLEALASTYPVTTPPSIAFLSINAEELPSVSEEYEVSAVPLVVLQRNGQTLERISGSDAAKVRNAVEKYATKAGDTSNGGFNLPPEQKVTRPKEGEEPTAVPTLQPKTNGHAATDTNGSVKNLSGYVPPADGPTTAPEVTGGEIDKEALHKRLDGLVKAAPVMLFMKGTPSAPKCGFSRTLVGLLRDRSIRYGFFNILADEDVRSGLKEYSDWPTFPQLYVDGELVGGLDIVKEELENNPEFLTQYAAVSKEADAAAA